MKAEEEVVQLCSDLIRIDSSNPTSNERAAAEHVAALLSDVGLEPLITESEPGRASVMARFEGPGRGDALLVHHHLDVVPADPADWTVHPFSGEVKDGYVWGRGAVDMKNSVAATLAVVREMRREGRRPGRDIVLAFNADEESGGHYGVKHVVAKHTELFDGCTDAIGKVGGFSATIGDRRTYLIQVAERGQAWMRLTATGRAGHGSMRNDQNAVTRLAEAIARIGAHRFPVRLVDASREFLKAIGAEDASDKDLGPIGKMVDMGMRHSANPTMLEAGYKLNVIPERAVAHVDGRFLPGLEEEFLATVDELLGPDVTREFVHHDIALETGFEGELVDRMTDAVTAEDPGARLVPFCMPGATDAKSYAPMGIRCFGFTPLRLPEDLDFAAMFHGVDERVPVEALTFSTRVLARLFGA